MNMILNNLFKMRVKQVHPPGRINDDEPTTSKKVLYRIPIMPSNFVSTHTVEP